MTLSRRRQVRRAFLTASNTQTAPGISSVMNDLTVRSLASTADPEIHEISITGIATSSADEAIHALVVHIGRTSTHPAIDEAGVRVRHVGANTIGLPFFVRYKALRLNPGDILGMLSYVEVEEDAASIHSMTIVVKDVWTELD